MSAQPSTPSASPDREPAMHPTLFIELRCEELPARFVRLAEAGLRDAVLQLLSGVAHGAVRTWATPRRVALAIEDLAPARPEELSVVTGPAEAASYRDGKPTPAAIGFAKGKGVPVEELILVDSPKGRVIAAQVRSGGQRVVDLLAQGLGDAILGIPFVHTMTWGPARWARPPVPAPHQVLQRLQLGHQALGQPRLRGRHQGEEGGGVKLASRLSS